VRIESAINR